jgi:2-amino-4-hydroxy-6-hydroxymethyldihydropteridine diphosphokinase
MTSTYIALGSNLDQPLQQLKTAILGLQALPDTSLITVSRFYQTTPVGFLNQPDFINAVAYLETTLSPQNLLAALQKIENNQGRIRKEKNGPRTLDLDILLYGDQTIAEANLVIPHPRMQERAFVLVPLLEIAPHLILPDGKSVQACLIKLRDATLY